MKLEQPLYSWVNVGSHTRHLAVLRQSVQIKPHETVADVFGVTDALALLSRAEAGEATSEELANADWTIEERIATTLARVGLDAPTDNRLAELSGGQGTRARLAAAIFAEPDFLLLDEPTNNLDQIGREAIIKFLAAWRGGAIRVRYPMTDQAVANSHERSVMHHPRKSLRRHFEYLASASQARAVAAREAGDLPALLPAARDDRSPFPACAQ